MHGDNLPVLSKGSVPGIRAVLLTQRNTHMYSTVVIKTAALSTSASTTERLENMISRVETLGNIYSGFWPTTSPKVLVDTCRQYVHSLLLTWGSAIRI